MLAESPEHQIIGREYPGTGMNRRETGSLYEAAAAAYLEEQGYRILARNFRSRRAEIDIVAQEGRYLVFVEVKHRAGTRHGTGPDAVTRCKQQRICSAAAYYLRRFRISADMPVRFDVLAIDGNGIRLIRNAFPYIL